MRSVFAVLRHARAPLTRARRTLVERIRDYGVVDLITDLVARASTALVAGGHRRRAQPSLNDLYSAASDVHTDARELVAAHFTGGSGDAQLVAQEATEAMDTLAKRYVAAELPYPVDWSVGQGTAHALYAIVRSRQPDVVVETGVANGHSSYLILRALARNGRGRLISIDVDPRAGVLVDPALRASWDLRILPETQRAAAFSGLMGEIGAADIFIHDSDHRYQWQRLELAAAAEAVGSGGIIASDDVDASYAFIDVAGERGWRPVLLVERRKVFGIVIVP